MNFLSKIAITLIMLLSLSVLNGQALWTNDNMLLHVEGGALLHVEGDIVHQNNGVSDNSGTIQLDNDWINNTVFNVFLNSSPGLVVMTGFNQSIKGTTSTLFSNLELENVYEKSMYVDANVEQVLYLNDAELQVHNNVMHILNPKINSLQWGSGFVSGDTIGGYLARSTNKNAAYMFPVGSLDLDNTHRAVELIPSTADSSVYAVRLAAIDPEFDFTGTSFTASTGPFSRSALGNKIYGVNDKFYHHIARFHGTNQVNTKIFYFTSDQTLPYEFNGLSHWSTTSFIWDLENFEVDVTNALWNISNPDRFVLGNITDFSNDVFALTIRDKIIANVPQIFSPNDDGINDVLYVFGLGIQEVEFIIYNRWGEKVFETRDVNQGWDGTFKGKKAQPGVYVYYLNADLNTSENVQHSGDITLVR